MPKMHQNTIGGRTLAGPAGGAYALPQAPYPQWEGLRYDTIRDAILTCAQKPT